MISEKERSEAAENLRQFLSVPYDERVWDRTDLQTVGRLIGTPLGGNIIERLADLIDRQTCNDVGDDWEFHCSACGCELDIREMEVGEPTMWKDGAAQVPKYCPSCGAEVVTTSD